MAGLWGGGCGVVEPGAQAGSGVWGLALARRRDRASVIAVRWRCVAGSGGGQGGAVGGAAALGVMPGPALAGVALARVMALGVLAVGVAWPERCEDVGAGGGVAAAWRRGVRRARTAGRGAGCCRAEPSGEAAGQRRRRGGGFRLRWCRRIGSGRRLRCGAGRGPGDSAGRCRACRRVARLAVMSLIAAMRRRRVSGRQAGGVVGWAAVSQCRAARLVSCR